jgi:hypothetical protein
VTTETVIYRHRCDDPLNPRCFISTKTEIPHDYGGPGSAGAAARLRTALTATTDHSLNGIVCDKRFSYIGHFIYLQY